MAAKGRVQFSLNALKVNVCSDDEIGYHRKLLIFISEFESRSEHTFDGDAPYLYVELLIEKGASLWAC